MNDEPTQKLSLTQKLPRWLLWIACLMVLVVLMGVVLSIRAQRLPPMDRVGFDAAKSQWEDNRLMDYHIAIAVSGRQPGAYTVGVQQGIATTATLDGRDLTRPRTFGTWSVDGMFETLQRDLDTNEADGNLMLGAEFHETLGIPIRYERLEMRTGVHDSLQWEVTDFDSP